MSNEQHQKQMRDSDMIFTQISTSAAEDYEMAMQMLVHFYIPDMTICRGGISHAIKRLEKFYKDKEKQAPQ